MESVNSDFLQKLKESAQGTFWEHIGAEIVTVSPKEIIIRVEIRRHHLNHLGILHGGVHAALLDSTMGLAAMIARPEDRVVTTNLNIHYLAPADKGALKVTAGLIHSSRKLITAQGFVYDEEGKRCAFGTGTFRVIPPQKGV
ncbi:PaaI family thioesterase [Paenibacillus sp. GD4]|uniref:PaaI family thioesterase n=1 Tax=Paenibacillus sp. GD4 TaxID=3068890 RepID=UPI002796D5BA|nr:PaaI family thioesterase [Paenibacillus sp. GD4]MDQ1909291.1 PaaI family thioesterase [Paenibacillus sp. GD4]